MIDSVQQSIAYWKKYSVKTTPEWLPQFWWAHTTT